MNLPGQSNQSVFQAKVNIDLRAQFSVLRELGSAGSDQASRIISHDPLHYSSKPTRGRVFQTPYRNRHIFHTVMSSSPTPFTENYATFRKISSREDSQEKQIG